MKPRLAYPLDEAAQLIGVSVRSLRYLLQQGRVGFVRLGRRVLVKHEDLEKLLKQHYCRPGAHVDVDAPIRPRVKHEGPERRTRGL